MPGGQRANSSVSAFAIVIWQVGGSIFVALRRHSTSTNCPAVDCRNDLSSYPLMRLNSLLSAVGTFQDPTPLGETSRAFERGQSRQDLVWLRADQILVFRLRPPRALSRRCAPCGLRGLADAVRHVPLSSDTREEANKRTRRCNHSRFALSRTHVSLCG